MTFTYSPFAVALQCLIAIGIGTWGVLGVQGPFQPIRTTEVLGKQTIDNLEPVRRRIATIFYAAAERVCASLHAQGPDFQHFNIREHIRVKGDIAAGALSKIS